MIEIEDVQGTGRGIRLRKLVVKLGSSVVVGEGHEIDEAALSSLADSIAGLKRRGVAVILVSSGAIGLGRRSFPAFKARTIPDRQALAAVGQVNLMHAYARLFEARGMLAAQVLLTRGDMEDRRRYLNARYTLERLLDLGAVPVINENDTTTIEELKFGDNDELSALVATKMNADLLVLLSVVDGLYAGDPARRAKNKANDKSGPIAVVETFSAEILALAGASRSSLGSGGMTSKLSAARMAHQAGIHAVIAGGKTAGILDQIAGGKFRGTYFAPGDAHAMSGRERWIAFGRKPLAGRQVVVDLGAREALVARNKSLLPAGVREVRGDFAKGDLVEIVTPDGGHVGQGLVNYGAAELGRIRGMKSAQIRELLGALDYEEAIHRDNLFVTA